MTDPARILAMLITAGLAAYLHWQRPSAPSLILAALAIGIACIVVWGAP